MDQQARIRTVEVTRYITPLREGGSLPAIVEADDEFLYVLKFRGAGQGGESFDCRIAWRRNCQGSQFSRS